MISEPIIYEKDEFKLKICYWFNEYDNRPYYSHALFVNGKNVLLCPYLSKKLTIDQMIGMYKARETRGYMR